LHFIFGNKFWSFFLGISIESMDPGDEEGDEPTIYGDPGD